MQSGWSAAPCMHSEAHQASSSRCTHLLGVRVTLLSSPSPLVLDCLPNGHRQVCLTENPKSYSTWHHRKWVVLQGHTDLQREMKLVNRCGTPSQSKSVKVNAGTVGSSARNCVRVMFCVLGQCCRLHCNTTVCVGCRRPRCWWCVLALCGGMSAETLSSSNRLY